nr:MAG TPA: hypothetical protein [Caudoviricetes sp.]
MCHESLAEYETRHLWVRRIMEQKVQRMLRHALFSLSFVGVDVERQSCDGFGKNTDTGIDCRRLHCSTFVDRLARRRLPKQKGQATEVILGLVP